MRLRWLAVLSAIAGAALIVYAVAVGEASAGVFVVFPFVVGSGPFAFAGIVLLFLGVAGLFASFAVPSPPARPGSAREGRGSAPPTSPTPADREAERESRGGGVILIGPIPIVFGSDSRIALVAAVAGLILLVGLLAWLWL